MNTLTAAQTVTPVRSPFGLAMQDVSSATSLQDAMRDASIDFEVQRWDLTASSETGISPVTNHVGLVRTDNSEVISVVGAKYGVIQNHEAFAPLDYMMREGFIESIDSAGSLDNGAKVFMLANLAASSRIQGDAHTRQLLIATTHDGSGATTARGWLHRLHCTNQIPAIFSKKGTVQRIRHTSRAQNYLQDFRHAVIASMESIGLMEDRINVLNDIDTTAWQVEQFIDRMFPKPIAAMDVSKYRAASTVNDRQRGYLAGLIYDAPTNENIRGKASALFAAAVEYSDYYSRGKRSERILRGRDVEFKSRALHLAELVTA